MDDALDPVHVGREDLPDGATEVAVSLVHGQAVALPRSLRRLSPEGLAHAADMQQVVRQIEHLQSHLREMVDEGRTYYGMSWDLLGWLVGKTGPAVRQSMTRGEE